MSTAVESGPEPVVRRLGFAGGTAAVITTFEGMITVNWSAAADLGAFLRAVEATVAVDDSPEVRFQRLGEQEVVEYRPSEPRPSRWPFGAESRVRLFRIDVSNTRSVAWQRLDSTTVVVGLGDEGWLLERTTSALGEFMEHTAVAAVDIGRTLSTVRAALGGPG